jgi:hypothetical protein
VVIYEETNEQKIDHDHLTKEEKINLIRYGPDAILNRPKRIAINLLAKYKPMINLTEYRILADKLDRKARMAEKLISLQKDVDLDSAVSSDEEIPKPRETKNSLRRSKSKGMRRPIVLNKNGDREMNTIVVRNVSSSGYGKVRPTTTKHSSVRKVNESPEKVSIFAQLRKDRR